jgi:2,4-dienoyl-CoA reductase-like NADH-dependent reductase (Old Yellow Enzyme family)
MTTSLFEPLTFRRGPAMPNRFMLAPLTNLQSHPDGTLSDEEFRWLTMRATGGFGATMTCAAHVQARGQGFPGQLGVFGDQHIAGLSRLAAAITAAGSVSLLQLHHAGIRSPRDLIGETPVGPSDDEATGARALTTDEVRGLIDDFVCAAVRAQRAGFAGVELHGAHGYIVCAFLSPELNRRTDQFGGDAAGRSLVLFDTLRKIREACGQEFIVGVRLSPERFGVVLPEIISVAQQLLTDERVDFVDMSLWDCFKKPEDPNFGDRLLIEYFTGLQRNGTRLGVAGKLYSAADVTRVLQLGADFVLPGRAAILHHDFPRQVHNDPNFVAAQLPVSATYLRSQGLSDSFLNYMRTWKGFVRE